MTLRARSIDGDRNRDRARPGADIQDRAARASRTETSAPPRRAVSVSGRGISTAGVTSNSRREEFLAVRRYRRAARARRAARSSAETSHAAAASTSSSQRSREPLRSTPQACASSNLRVEARALDAGVGQRVGRLRPAARDVDGFGVAASGDFDRAQALSASACSWVASASISGSMSPSSTRSS